MLEPTELRLYRSETEIVRFAQAEGYLQVAENRALVLVEEAIAPERSTARRRERLAESRRRRAAPRTARNGSGAARHPRYEAFLAVGRSHCTARCASAASLPA